MSRLCFIVLASVLPSAFDLPDGISEAGPNTYKIAISTPIAFPHSSGEITPAEKSAVRDAKDFCGRQNHPQVFVISFATPTDSSVTFNCADSVRSVP